jgi:hypothetical protein
MQNVLYAYYLVLFRPGQAFQRFGQRANWWYAALAVLAGATVLALHLAALQQSGIGQLLPTLLIIWGIAGLGWFKATLFLSFTADLFGGQGRMLDTMTSLGLASLPLVLAAPLLALPNLLGQVGFSLRLVGIVVLGFWCFALGAQALRAAQELPLDKAIGSLVVSLFLGLGLGAAVMILSLSQFALWLG